MADVYQIVTDRILNLLELGEIPWHRPWCTVNGGAFNRISGKQYSLLNQMLLSHTGEYATFGQWTKLGGQIRKGEKSEIVVFWKWQEPQDDGTDELADVRKAKPVLRFYRVFHVSQVEGIAPQENRIRLHQHEPTERAEMLVHGYTVREGIRMENTEFSDSAYYSPGGDIIHIPPINQYEYPEEYYSTALHEMIHSTGHEKRLNRPGLRNASFGSTVYSKEELIAEIGSACLMNLLGIETDRSLLNSAGYIQGWMSALRSDKRLVVLAAGQAEKATKYILDRHNPSDIQQRK